MGRMKIDKRHLIWGAAGLAVIVLASLGIWWFGTERLPGYDMDSVYRLNYVEPGGDVAEYFNGVIKMKEYSIRGPKMTVTADLSNSDRTFFVSKNAEIWLGLDIGDSDITGKEKTDFEHLKKGQRVAVFIGDKNEATHIHILKR